MVIKNKYYKPIILSEFEKHPYTYSKEEITSMCVFQDLPITFIGRYAKLMNWKAVCEYHYEKLTPKYIKKYLEYIDWKELLKHKTIEEDFIREIIDDLYNEMVDIVPHVKFSKEFIEQYSYKFNWSDIWKYQSFDSEFVEKHIEYVYDKRDWRNISIHYKLSKDFMIKYKKKLFWGELVQSQYLDADLIAKCSDCINFYKLLNSPELNEHYERSETTLRYIFSVAQPNVILWWDSNWRNMLSVDFIREFKDRIKENIFFDSIKRDEFNYKIVDEFADIDKHAKYYITDMLKVKHDYAFTTKHCEDFSWWNICNYPEFQIKNLYISCPEERQFLIEQKEFHETMFNKNKW